MYQASTWTRYRVTTLILATFAWALACSGGPNGAQKPHVNAAPTTTTTTGGTTGAVTPPPVIVPPDPPNPWGGYMTNPNNSTNVPNDSFAGYHYGETPLPNPTGPTFEVKALYGAHGDGITDDTAAVRAAITAAANAKGGVVYFEAGTYLLSAPIFVNDSNIILRGANRATTTLAFARSLNTSYATATNSQGSSNWGVEGGMVWFSPRTSAAFPAATSNIADLIGWNIGAQLATVTNAAQRGQMEIALSDTSNIPIGGFVALRVVNPTDNSLAKYIEGDGSWAGAFAWSTAPKFANMPFTWPVEVVAVKPTSIVLRQPLRFDLRPGWRPTVFALGAPVTESGIENLTIQLKRDYTWDTVTYHHHEAGWNGVFFLNAINCFARSVSVVDADGVAFATSFGKNITFTDISVDASGPAKTAQHHSLMARSDSHDILFQNFTINATSLHGISLEARSMGIVWSKGTMLHGTFDTHKGLPMDVLRTEITITNDGLAGGDPDAGPQMGARFVNWNVQVTGKVDMVGAANLMPLGVLMGVTGIQPASSTDPTQGDSQCIVVQSGTASKGAPMPPNLYEAQRILRVGH